MELSNNIGVKRRVTKPKRADLPIIYHISGMGDARRRDWVMGIDVDHIAYCGRAGIGRKGRQVICRVCRRVPWVL